MFFKPTKAKVILAIVLLPVAFFIVSLLLSLFGTNYGGVICISSLPTVSGTPQPTPTPQPFTVSNVTSDIKYTSGGANCLGNGPTEHAATFLFSSYQFIIGIILPIISSYLISCLIIFFVAKMRRQKKNNTSQAKK